LRLIRCLIRSGSEVTEIIRLAAECAACFAGISLCAAVHAGDSQVANQQPMKWPREPLLSCNARVEYAQQFLLMMKQGLPEERIQFASDWDPQEELDEILEIRRRVYHDRDGLNEILACAAGSGT
jgi:hypothetical protein